MPAASVERAGRHPTGDLDQRTRTDDRLVPGERRRIDSSARRSLVGAHEASDRAHPTASRTGRKARGTASGGEDSTNEVNPRSWTAGARSPFDQSSTVVPPDSSTSRLNGCMSPWQTTTGSSSGRRASNDATAASRSSRPSASAVLRSGRSIVSNPGQRLRRRRGPLDRRRVDAVQRGEDGGEGDRQAPAQRRQRHQRPDTVEAGEQRLAVGQRHDHERSAVDPIDGTARGEHPRGGEALIGDLGLEHGLLGGGLGIGHDPGDQRAAPPRRRVGQAEGDQLGPEPAGERDGLLLVAQLGVAGDPAQDVEQARRQVRPGPQSRRPP